MTYAYSKAQRMNIFRRLRRRYRRFTPHTDYVCTGCGWWFHHLTGDRWLGPYYHDMGYTPHRVMTWEELEESESDCASRLIERQAVKPEDQAAADATS